MARYIIVNARGNGDCLLNAITLDMAYSLQSGLEDNKWLNIIANPLYLHTYRNLAILAGASRDIDTTSIENESASAEAVLQCLKAFFQDFNLNNAQDKTAVQGIISPLLRASMVEAIEDKDTMILDKDGQPILLNEILNQTFQESLEENILAYPSQRRACNIFQDHPAFNQKLRSLFKGIDLDALTDEAHRQSKNQDEFYKEKLKPQIEAFQRWFSAGSKVGFRQFMNHKSHGLKTPGNENNNFTYAMISSLYGVTIRYKNHAQANGQDYHSDDTPWRIEGHRFYFPKPRLATSEADKRKLREQGESGDYIVDNYEPTEDDLCIGIDYVPGHYMACIPSAHYDKVHQPSAPRKLNTAPSSAKAPARDDADLTANDRRMSSMKEPNSTQSSNKDEWSPWYGGIVLALMSFTLAPVVSSIPMMIAISAVAFFSGTFIASMIMGKPVTGSQASTQAATPSSQNDTDNGHDHHHKPAPGMTYAYQHHCSQCHNQAAEPADDVDPNASIHARPTIH